jgi:hypothetical protein
MDEFKGMKEKTALNHLDTLSPFLDSSKMLIQRYTHCSFCGANLHFSYITDFNKNLTQEISRCLECGLKAKKRLHKLQ